MPNLTFPQDKLARWDSGALACTMRFDRRLKKARIGEAVSLQFGAYNRPTLRRATLSDFAVIDLTRALAIEFSAEPEDDILPAGKSMNWLEDQITKARDGNKKARVFIHKAYDLRQDAINALDESQNFIIDVMDDYLWRLERLTRKIAAEHGHDKPNEDTLEHYATFAAEQFPPEVYALWLEPC